MHSHGDLRGCIGELEATLEARQSTLGVAGVTTTSFRISLLVPRERIDESVQHAHARWVAGAAAVLLLAGCATDVEKGDRLLAGGTGEIRVFGRALASYPQKELARRLGYVPQADERLFPFTVEQFVTMARYPYFSPFRSVARDAGDPALHHPGPQPAESAKPSMGRQGIGDRQCADRQR